MKLSEILKNISTKNSFDNDVEINNIQFDSRLVKKGDLFVATRGTAADGHDFIEKAVESGASVVICEKIPEKFTIYNLQFTIIEVENSLEVLGKIASNFYKNPSQKLRLVGVTGTNGKTTIATLLYKLFLEMGFKAGLLSTIKNYVCEKEYETINTTPNPLEINKLLAEMVDVGCEYCFMEVSSHAVAQHRISGLEFAGGIFTNLTRDHLDYHITMENYRDAKKLFFDNLPKTAFALTNLDDKNGEFMLQNTKAQKYTYSLRTLADFKTKILEHDFEGMELLLEQRTKNQEPRRYEMATSFVGKFNASNLTAVFGTAVLLAPLNPPSRGDLSHYASEAHKNKLYNTANPAVYEFLKENAKNRRKNPTNAENILWQHIQNKQFEGYKFRREHIIGDFIVDFVCLSEQLIIEVDGGYHNEENQQEFDKIRSEYLNKRGFRVIRFTNEEVLNNINKTLETVKVALRQSPPEGDLGGFEVEILTKLSLLQSVSGRFEVIRGGGVTAIVDYAHTPDALKNVLATINDIMQKTDGHLICVVGCGGDRDKGKRPLMAKEAVNQSHTAIFTSDNPRSENPDVILADMLAGLNEAQKENVLTISDRRQAIKTAVKLARKNDCILIAGKGHEDYQIIGNEKRHFDDREEVKKCLNYDLE